MTSTMAVFTKAESLTLPAFVQQPCGNLYALGAVQSLVAAHSRLQVCYLTQCWFTCGLQESHGLLMAADHKMLPPYVQI